MDADLGCPAGLAADCGAGVGRVSEQLLLHHFAEVDLVEPSGEGRLPKTSYLHLPVAPAKLPDCLLYTVWRPRPRPSGVCARAVRSPAGAGMNSALAHAAHLLAAARKRLCGKGAKPFPPGHAAVGFFQAGLEAFDPEPGRYDVIWVQWAALYLTDGAGAGAAAGGRAQGRMGSAAEGSTWSWALEAAGC